MTINESINEMLNLDNGPAKEIRGHFNEVVELGVKGAQYTEVLNDPNATRSEKLEVIGFMKVYENLFEKSF